MIRDNETGWVEATIVINGQPLTFAQSMSVRVAVAAMIMHTSEDESRALLGVQLAENYRVHLVEVERLMRSKE